MGGFPDKASIEKLRWYGIKTVVLHLTAGRIAGVHAPEIPEPPDPVAAAAKPVTGLGVTRRRVGDVVIYEIGPGRRRCTEAIERSPDTADEHSQRHSRPARADSRARLASVAACSPRSDSRSRRSCSWGSPTRP